jgi:hypothetical protein
MESASMLSNHPRRRLALCIALCLFPAATTFAGNECGPATTGTAVVCSPTPTPYDKVHYEGVSDFHLILQPGVRIDGDASGDGTSGLRVRAQGDVTIDAGDDVVISAVDSWEPAVEVSTLGGDATLGLDTVHGGGFGVLASTVDGDLQIDAHHVDGLNGIVAGVVNGNATVEVDVAKAADGTAIMVSSTNGNLAVDAGEVHAAGQFSNGVWAMTYEGDVNVTADMVFADG